MRVRHLQSHLANQNLIHTAKLETLSGVRVVIDAVYWLRSIQALKDPFADAIGGIPPGIFGFVDRELDQFRMYNIQPIFVFQGMATFPQHSMFISRVDQQLELAWTLLAQGQRNEAQKCFAISTSRINSDFVYFIFHHLRQKGCEVFQAPYFACAQIAHMLEQEVVQTAFGPPGLLLYGASRVVINIDFVQGTFDWIVLESVLAGWGLNQEQFIEACMLAGTEYCLTHPYLNLGNFQAARGGQVKDQFNFDSAVVIVKTAPLIQWMQSFPMEEIMTDHIEGYCICKVLVQSSPVLHLRENAVRPLGSSSPGSGLQVPYDFAAIMGQQLPAALYYLIMAGIISHKLPQALAKGEWVDKSQPVVDTKELWDLKQDVQEYRQLALGLIARHLNPSFGRKNIVCKAIWDIQAGRRRGGEQPAENSIKPKKITRSLRWRIMTDKLESEMRRQGVNKVDLKFCLEWHANEFQTDGQLYKDLTKFGDSTVAHSRSALAALVHFMLLEHVGLIADDGGMTVLGHVLKDSPRHLQEPMLIALEMIKFGVLNAEPFESASPQKPFPSQVNYPRAPVDSATKSALLLGRAMSLVPMKLRNDLWNSDVDFDLAAFHCLVRILKRELRQLVEASLASILLKDMSRAKLLPPDCMCATPKKEDHLQNNGLLPTFLLPRSCMGIVVLFFLRYQGDAANFSRDLQARFPCCQQPREDLRTAFHFWDDLRRCVDAISEPLGAEELAAEMRAASEMLQVQQRRLQLFARKPGERAAAPPQWEDASPGMQQQPSGGRHRGGGGLQQGPGGLPQRWP